MKKDNIVPFALKYASDLMGSHEYKVVVEAVQNLKPVVPAYDYKNQSNIEEIKFKLAQLQMFNTVMSILKPEAQNE